MTQPGVRAASLHGYVELATGFGVDPVAIAEAAGMDAGVLATPDRWIPAVGPARVLHATAEATGCADFGLRMSQQRRLSTIGPLSVVLREEPDVRSALDLLLRYERSYNEALHMELEEAGGLATVRVTFDAGQPVPAHQVLDLACAVLVSILRSFLGDEWTPTSVCFTHVEPPDTSLYRRLLGENLRFGHEFAGIVLRSADLDRTNDVSDPALRPYAQQLLATLPSARPETAVDQVRELIEVLLPIGRSSVGQVARTLGVDRRTLHRHLAGHDETFTSVLHATRRRLAERYLANPRNSLTDVSGLLGFAAPSAFTRWFREQYDTSPSAWRRDELRHERADAGSSPG